MMFNPRDLLPTLPWEGPPVPRILQQMLMRNGFQAFPHPSATRIGKPERVHPEVPEPVPMPQIAPKIVPTPERAPMEPMRPIRVPVPVRVPVPLRVPKRW